MGKNTDGKAWLTALVVTQDGKPVVGAPQKGAHQIALKPGMKFYGNKEEIASKLANEFKNCTFKWA